MCGVPADDAAAAEHPQTKGSSSPTRIAVGESNILALTRYIGEISLSIYLGGWDVSHIIDWGQELKDSRLAC